MGSACSTQHHRSDTAHSPNDARHRVPKKPHRMTVAVDANRWSSSNRRRLGGDTHITVEPSPHGSHPLSRMASEGAQLTIGPGSVVSGVPNGCHCPSSHSQSFDIIDGEERPLTDCTTQVHFSATRGMVHCSAGGEHCEELAHQHNPLTMRDAFGDDTADIEVVNGSGDGDEELEPSRWRRSTSLTTSQEWRDHHLLFDPPRSFEHLEPPCGYSYQDLATIEPQDAC